MNLMTKTKLAAIALVPMAMLVFSGCKTHTESSPFADNPKARTEKGVPGGVIVENYHDINARVTAIDAVKRTVTVVEANGTTSSFLCGSVVRNFDQIRVGDQLKVRLTELLSAALVGPNEASPDSSSTLLVRAPEGDMPAAAFAETTRITATITGIDTLRHIVSLRFPDGSLHHYAIRPDVSLKGVQHGEKVVISKTMAMAIWVQIP